MVRPGAPWHADILPLIQEIMTKEEFIARDAQQYVLLRAQLSLLFHHDEWSQVTSTSDAAVHHLKIWVRYYRLVIPPPPPSPPSPPSPLPPTPPHPPEHSGSCTSTPTYLNIRTRKESHVILTSRIRPLPVLRIRPGTGWPLLPSTTPTLTRHSVFTLHVDRKPLIQLEKAQPGRGRSSSLSS